jgi:hypothetical protein
MLGSLVKHNFLLILSNQVDIYCVLYWKLQACNSHSMLCVPLYDTLGNSQLNHPVHDHIMHIQ